LTRPEIFHGSTVESHRTGRVIIHWFIGINDDGTREKKDLCGTEQYTEGASGSYRDIVNAIAEQR
jgi:hypothetical protein